LDSITGDVGTMAYENASSYSSATEVDTALENKANIATTLTGYGITDAYTKSETSGATEISNALETKADNSEFTAHTASSVHMTSTEKENLDSLATNIAAISGVTSTKVSNWDGAVTNLGGFKLVEITQSDYDNLPTPRDSKTLYIIRN